MNSGGKNAADKPGGEAAGNNKVPVVSPCVSICVLGPGDVCQGCYRTGAEIRQWVMLDSDGRRTVINKARERSKVGNPFA